MPHRLCKPRKENDGGGYFDGVILDDVEDVGPAAVLHTISFPAERDSRFR
jgi:hypothetical protein